MKNGFIFLKRNLLKLPFTITLCLSLLFSSCGEPHISMISFVNTNNYNTLVNTTQLTSNTEYPNGGVITEIGLDKNNDNELSQDEITSTTIYVNDDEDTYNDLVLVNNQNVGLNCENGGQAINIGTDTNNNNILDNNEIVTTEFLCNDSDHIPSLTVISNVSPGSNCLNGCIEIETGIDSNLNQILDNNEIENSYFVDNYENPIDSFGNASIRGVVKDAVTDLPLENVTIIVSSNGQEMRTETTNSSGVYIIENISDELTYEITYELEGYLQVIRSEVTINPDVINFIETTLLISDDNTSNGNIQGLITNAFTGIGEPTVNLSIREGLGNLDGETITTTTTDLNGNYSLNNLSAGNYTIEISKDDFITTSFSVQVLSAITNQNQNSTISPIIAEGEIRIVLEWLLEPNDLDSHLTGPLEGGERFHTFYANSFPFNSNSSLDVDDTSGFGPETITISQTIEGVYRYSVHNFDSYFSFLSFTTLENSSAIVKLYIGDTNLTFNVPNGTGNLWTVFEIDGSSLTVTPINSITNITDEYLVQKTAINKDDSYLIKNLPKK